MGLGQNVDCIIKSVAVRISLVCLLVAGALKRIFWKRGNAFATKRDLMNDTLILIAAFLQLVVFVPECIIGCILFMCDQDRVTRVWYDSTKETIGIYDRMTHTIRN